MGINRIVLISISVVTSLGRQSYSEARFMLATARGTIISINITPCIISGRDVNESSTAEAMGTMINF